MELDGLVDTLAAASVRLMGQMVTELGSALPPTVYLLSKYASPPLLGTVTTRPFYRGADGAEAVVRLGVLPAATGALRLLVVWENADLCAALDRPGWQDNRHPHGVVLLDAHRDERLGHTVRWHPYRLTAVDPASKPGHTGMTAEGWPVVVDWGADQCYPNGRLPQEIAEVLAVWRRPRPDADVAATRAELTATGFTVVWKQPEHAAQGVSGGHGAASRL